MEANDLPISITVLNIILLPFALASSIAHGLVAFIYLSKKYVDVSQIKTVYACISIIDIFNLTLQTLLLPIFNRRLGWFEVIILYIVDIVEYCTVYLTCLVACHIHRGVSQPFKYHVAITAGKKYLFFQIGVIVAVSLIVPPVFNSYENLSSVQDDNMTIYISAYCQCIQAHQFERTERNQFAKYEKIILLQIIPLFVGFFLAFRATCIIWEMKELPAMPRTRFIQTRQENRNKGLIIIAVLVTITVAIFPRTLYKLTHHQWVDGYSFADCNLFYLLFAGLYFVRFAVNPIIYWFLGIDFRDGLKKILRF